uniref:Uncharacterized protein n=1 Tax=Lygus hesperus TaxID=30085 RepID=A0A146M2U7_LYGHE
MVAGACTRIFFPINSPNDSSTTVLGGRIYETTDGFINNMNENYQDVRDVHSNTSHFVKRETEASTIYNNEEFGGPEYAISDSKQELQDELHYPTGPEAPQVRQGGADNSFQHSGSCFYGTERCGWWIDRLHVPTPARLQDYDSGGTPLTSQIDLIDSPEFHVTFHGLPPEFREELDEYKDE